MTKVTKKVCTYIAPDGKQRAVFCKKCNEAELFCFCDIKQQAKQAKALEVKRIKRGTFLFSF